MLGMLGGVVFSVSEDKIKTFQGLKRDTSARYADHDVIGAKAKREFLGADLNTMSFSMSLSAFQGVSPLKQEELLREYCEKGEEQTLIIGGKNFGEFCIEKVSASYEIVNGDGEVLSAKIDVSLKEYH